MVSAAPNAATSQAVQLAGERPATRSARCAWILCGLLLLTAAVRLPGLNRPLAGNFATKNVIYAMIARNWAEGRAPAWLPTVDCIEGGERGWHLLEVPVSAYLTGLAWRCCGGSLDAWGRLTSIGFSVAAVALLYLLVARWHGSVAAAGAGAVLALSPVSIIFGQSFMLEASLVAFTLATFYCLDVWLAAGRSRWLVLAAVGLALAVLTKIYMLVLLAPLSAMVWQARRTMAVNTRQRRWLPAGAAAIVAVAPGLGWFAMAMHLGAPGGPLSERVYYSVRQSASDHPMPHPLLSTPDFYRQAMDDLAGPALTPIGLLLVMAGCLHPAGRRHAIWLAAMAGLVVLLPAKFYAMNYYYLVVLPPLCVMAGLGWHLVHQRLGPGRVATAALLLAGLAFSMRHAAKPAFSTPQEDRSVVVAAAALDEIAGPQEPVVTVHGSAPDLLYYCNRPGWALSAASEDLDRQLAEAERQGARWLVVAGLDQASSPATQTQLDRRALISSGPDFRVYRLRAADSTPLLALPAGTGTGTSTARESGAAGRQ
ncbi:MAG: glycosyltransferase family 39 protein [Pirellulales bacterium]